MTEKQKRPEVPGCVVRLTDDAGDYLIKVAEMWAVG